MLTIFSLTLIFLVRHASTMDGILVTSVGVLVDDTQLGCGSVKVLIENTQSSPNCFKDGTRLFLVYNGTAPIEKDGNLTLLLEVVTLDETKKTTELNFTGTLVPDNAAPNTLHTETVLMALQPTVGTTTTTVAPTTITIAPTTAGTTVKPVATTAKPKEKGAKLTVNYIHMKFDDDCKKVVKNRNGGAVTVAIIEGIVLIAILVYIAYKTMINQKRKQTATIAAFPYDSNASRITVSDSIRMSDIPPARSPPTVTQQPVRAQMTSPELVVPTSTTAPSNQFSDPFESLDSW